MIVTSNTFRITLPGWNHYDFESAIGQDYAAFVAENLPDSGLAAIFLDNLAQFGQSYFEAILEAKESLFGRPPVNRAEWYVLLTTVAGKFESGELEQSDNHYIRRD